MEAGSVMGWEKYSKNNMGINSFGESGPYKEVYKHFDLTSDKIVELAKKLVR
ncbi:MAG: transketolase-like TK C-terminal-containing protein [Pelagibacteraceae bacterium]